MKRTITPFFLAAALLPAACSGDETVAAYGGADHVWRLESLDGAPVTSRATLEFGENGRISGQAPCNRFTGSQTVPYPWFQTGPLAATRMACPDLEAEARYLTALEAMSQSEVSGDVLRLSNEDGREMLFRPEG